MTDHGHQHKAITENGVVAGNFYDKYTTANPIAKLLMENFSKSIRELAIMSGACEIHEVGCGEGHLSRMLATMGPDVRGSDFSQQIIEKANQLSQSEGVHVPFKAASIYDLQSSEDAAELIVCCEVLEHLEAPEKALELLSKLAKPYIIVSVPREPLWRLLNMARGKYLTSLGNTPGHINHWSLKQFLRLISAFFDIIEVRTPLPWSVVFCRAKNL
ncbi:class I SAM-dependent methyltransferase [Geomonas edaphica]|uniref:class I SAM-dependent methyltransferase n=1 Tax=Geomonas edaphica TaxID=2570226 RepID=UPI0010A7E8E4|nr:class I SAM-dependent methyltransferase [Geomonas edaphica]